MEESYRFALSLALDTFCIILLENIHLKLMTSATFCDFWRQAFKFEQTQHVKSIFLPGLWIKLGKTAWVKFVIFFPVYR